MSNQDKKGFLLYVWQPEVQSLECPADTLQRRNVAKQIQDNFFATSESTSLTLRRHRSFRLVDEDDPPPLRLFKNPGSWIKGNS